METSCNAVALGRKSGLGVGVVALLMSSEQHDQHTKHCESTRKVWQGNSHRPRFSPVDTWLLRYCDAASPVKREHVEG
jgi:hypothetical protein